MPGSRRGRTGAWLAAHWPEVALGFFVLANLAAIVLVPSAETVPFHFVWVSLTLAYGFRAWKLRSTVITLGLVMVLTGIMLSYAVAHTEAGFDEVTEVPLMAVMFAVVMLHVERRQAALDEVRRLAENEHRLIERERNLIRDASHELRTPITVARGHAELIRNTCSDDVARDAEVVLDELNRLSRIAERLLLLAAAEHPGFLRLGPVDLERLVVETASRWSAAAKRRWQVDAPLEGSLLADEERLQTTLDALVENAVRFTGEHDRVAIAARGENGSAVIEVSDTGIGIRPEELPRIFDRFSRLDEGRRRGNGGTGLGLAIVKAIVEAHGGSVAVVSQPGDGTTFTLSLPGFRATSTASRAELAAGAPGDP